MGVDAWIPGLHGSLNDSSTPLFRLMGIYIYICTYLARMCIWPVLKVHLAFKVYITPPIGLVKDNEVGT